MTRPWRLLALLLMVLPPGFAHANAAPFDLAGPSLTITVTHAGETLPIAQVPSLSAGDSLSVKADLPQGQSVKYLLVAAFLRGATNPPPESWFFQSQTWTRKGQDGLKIIVPKGAEQLLIFFAPQTGGDFKTLINAVRGRPGAFVRASQDLNQASLDRARLDFYLSALRRIDQQDPDQLKTASPLLARSLAIKLNADCLQKMAQLQAACLTQGQESLVLDDGHGTSLVQSLTSGDTASLTQQLSGTPQAGSGYYSPYIGAAIDIARIMDSFHTAQYQYIPALAVSKGDQLSLVLNTAPSFHQPMSVLVAAIPAIGTADAPPLEPVDPKAAYCLEKPGLVLPVDGAPLVFSTAYARHLVLRLKRDGAADVDAPLKADADHGGLVSDISALKPADRSGVTEASVHGLWGFSSFDGPRFTVRSAGPAHWRLAADDQQSLIIGRDDTVRFSAPQAPCVESISLRDSIGRTQPVDWKAADADDIAANLPLKDVQAGSVTLLIKQYGQPEPDAVPLDVFAQAGQLEHFVFHAGDQIGQLAGTRLDEVKSVTLAGALFRPTALVTSGGADTLTLTASDTQAVAALRPGDPAVAKVTLNNGHTANLKLIVAPPRPIATLISKSVEPQGPMAGPHIELIDKNELPQGAALAFSIQAGAPTTFSDKVAVEIAGGDGQVLTTLNLANGLVLEDSHVAVATLDTAKALNASVYGPLQFRVVEGGGDGDWQPLATLVRAPTIHEVRCAGEHGDTCELSGANLFLIHAIASDPGFSHAIVTPEGFTGFSLTVPRPRGGELFVKLHDDPLAVDHLVVGTRAATTRAAATQIQPVKPSSTDKPSH